MYGSQFQTRHIIVTRRNCIGGFKSKKRDFQERHGILCKFDALQTKIMDDAILYFDLVHLVFIFLVKCLYIYNITTHQSSLGNKE